MVAKHSEGLPNSLIVPVLVLAVPLLDITRPQPPRDAPGLLATDAGVLAAGTAPTAGHATAQTPGTVVAVQGGRARRGPVELRGSRKSLWSERPVLEIILAPGLAAWHTHVWIPVVADDGFVCVDVAVKRGHVVGAALPVLVGFAGQHGIVGIVMSTAHPRVGRVDVVVGRRVLRCSSAAVPAWTAAGHPWWGERPVVPDLAGQWTGDCRPIDVAECRGAGRCGAEGAVASAAGRGDGWDIVWLWWAVCLRLGRSGCNRGPRSDDGVFLVVAGLCRHRVAVGVAVVAAAVGRTNGGVTIVLNWTRSSMRRLAVAGMTMANASTVSTTTATAAS